MNSQHDGVINAVGTALIAEDDHVRLWSIDLAPGEEAPMHTHLLDYTSIALEGDIIERINGDGSVDRIEVRPGAITRWYQSTQTHGLRNVGTKRFRNIIVELKGIAANFG